MKIREAAFLLASILVTFAAIRSGFYLHIVAFLIGAAILPAVVPLYLLYLILE